LPAHLKAQECPLAAFRRLVKDEARRIAVNIAKLARIFVEAVVLISSGFSITTTATKD
jgi:hypothetical protein